MSVIVCQFFFMYWVVGSYSLVIGCVTVVVVTQESSNELDRCDSPVSHCGGGGSSSTPFRSNL